MAFSGVIPTISVSSNSLVNSVAGGLVNNVASSAVKVALSPKLSNQWASSSGLSPQSLTSLLSSAVTPGLISTGSQAISQSLTSSIVNSKALGPLGSLVQDYAGNAVSNLSRDLLGTLFPATVSSPTKYFPGAGNEPDADYQGYAYNPGSNGVDVVFSIKPAVSGAQAEITDQVSGKGGSGVQTSVPAGQSVPSSGGLSLTPKADYSTAFQSASGAVLGDLTKQANLAGSFRGVPFGSPDAFKAISTIPQILTSSTVGQPFSQDSQQSSVWNFICAPEEISWSTAVQVDRVPIFGTNLPPVISGSRGMRELSMSNALVEGFTRGKTIEGKVSDLEKLLSFTLDTQNGYVKVPVYWVYANNKRYGDVDGGCFLIKEVKVKEEMRDLTGLATRAKVDISFSQVPSYQVDDGRDVASKTVSGTTSNLGAVASVLSTRPVVVNQTTTSSSRGGGGVAGQTNQGVSPTTKIPGVPSGATNVKVNVDKKGETTVRYTNNGVPVTKRLPPGQGQF
jgi:hypothetical protein